MTMPMLTCDEFQSLLPDYLDGALSAAARDRADAHQLDCAECSALVSDLRAVVREAGAMPVLEPSRDLWRGIESRIAAEVVPLPFAGAAVAPQDTPAGVRGWSTRRLAVAASLLVMATAGITWSIANRGPVLVIPAGPAGADAAPGATPVQSVSRKPTMDETYDKEIGALRKIVDERRADLDSATIGILEKNLLVIDRAIRESRAALANDPASTFLSDRLSRAYDAKLQLLRGVVTTPSRS